MLRVGITGQSGFIGTHLYNYLGLQKEIERIPFKDEYFSDRNKLKSFVKECDVIVHLAAMNRHNDPEVLYNTNIKLVQDLIFAIEEEGVTPHVLFSSSTQEERDNLYGRSKKEGRKLFINWAKKNNAQFSGFVIPNVFGPFGNPYYNSVVATFSHQLTHQETPQIEVDSEMKLIYIGELVEEFWKAIHEKSKKRKEQGLKTKDQSEIETYYVPFTSEIRVSELLEKLVNYKEHYFKNGIIPSIKNDFERNLFNTFRCYIDQKSFFPFNLKLNTDERGTFVETIKLNSGGQVSFSTTKPGITRGNHFHTRKIERFAVIKGKAKIEIRRIGTSEVYSFELNGTSPSFVDMPIWFTHNITNIGNEDLYTIFWINEFYNLEDPDTYFEPV